jgi:uncharacterized protein YraI
MSDELPRIERMFFVLTTTIVFLVMSFGGAGAQDELAATLEVLSPGVEVLRVNTSNWLPVEIESIVGTGDTIRTDDSGQARVTYFADGTDVTLEANTSIQINTFSGDEDSFDVNFSVLAGETVQSIGRALGTESSYLVVTPAMTLGARGTVFAIRVENTGRAGLLVREGDVNASDEAASAQVPSGFGVRAEQGGELSEVVRASTFDELNAALDGCAISVTTSDDVSLNVRVRPSVDAPRVGTLAAADITNAIGVIESGGWYRIEFRGGFAWVLASEAAVGAGCAGLRLFPDDTPEEDASLYTSVGDPMMLEDLLPTATPSASG